MSAQTQADIVSQLDKLLLVGPGDAHFNPLFIRTVKRSIPFGIGPNLADPVKDFAWGGHSEVPVAETGDGLTGLWSHYIVDVLSDGLSNLQAALTECRFSYVSDLARAANKRTELWASNVNIQSFDGRFQHMWETIAVDPKLWPVEATGRFECEETRHLLACRKQRIINPLFFFFSDHHKFENALWQNAAHLTKFKLKFYWRSKADVVTPADKNSVTYTVGSADAAVTDFKVIEQLVWVSSADRKELTAPGKQFDYILKQVGQVSGSPQDFTSTARNLDVDLSVAAGVEELFFMFQSDDDIEAKKWFEFKGMQEDEDDGESFSTLQITFNSQPRYQQDPMPPYLFRWINMYDHHSSIPTGKNKYYCISFATNPQSGDPTGFYDMSRLQTAKAKFEFAATVGFDGSVYFYYRAYNWIKILKGVTILGLSYAPNLSD